MSRMSKRRRLEWSFFLDAHNRTSYNRLCRACIRNCKQSFRAIIVICPSYRSKRAIMPHDATVNKCPASGEVDICPPEIELDIETETDKERESETGHLPAPSPSPLAWDKMPGA